MQMRGLTFYFILILCLVTISCKKQPQKPQGPSNLSFSKVWGKAYGGSGSEWGWNVVSTKDGGYVSVGFTGSNDRDVSGYHGNQDAWVIKVDAFGNTVWQRCIGGTFDETAMGIIENTDGSLAIIGKTQSKDGDFLDNNGPRPFLLKLGKNGNLLWTKTYGNKTYGDIAYDVFRSFINDGNGNYIITGESDGQGWIMKVDSNGAVVWEKKYGGSDNDGFNAITVAADGFILAGSTKSNDGDVMSNHGGSDTWIMKIDKNGSKLWQKTYGGTSGDPAQDVVCTADGGLIVVGLTISNDLDMVGNHGEADAFVIKADKDGNKVWSKMFGGTGKELHTSIVSSNDGAYLVAIGTSSTSGELYEAIGLHDVWILKIDESGDDLGKHAIGGSGNDQLFAMAKSIDGSYIVEGSTNSPDGDVEGYQGYVEHDTWILKFRDQ
jgi:hypothetical protein